MSRMTPASPSHRHRRLPDLHALEAFVTVCDSGSMALAAQRLGLSQSAVSQAIKGLEQALNLKLLDREVRPAAPTRAASPRWTRSPVRCTSSPRICSACSPRGRASRPNASCST